MNAELARRAAQTAAATAWQAAVALALQQTPVPVEP